MRAERDRASRRYLLAVIETYRPQGAPGGTGGTLSNEHLLQVLSRRIPVKLLTLDGYEPPRLDPAHPDLTCDARPPCGLRKLRLVQGWLPYVRQQVQAAVERHGPPAAVLATTSTVCAIDPMLIGRAPSAVIVQAFENFGPLAPGVTLSTRISLAKQSIVRHFSDARHIRQATAVSANSEYMADQLQRQLRVSHKRIVVVPQLCDVKPLTPPAPAPPNTVGFVMRTADKNPELVVALARKAPDLTFRVFGSRPQGPTPLNLHVMGWASDRDQMFASARVWIVPSKWPEPFGRVSMEAQAADRPVAVANTGGLPETVVDPKYLVSGYEVDAWIDRIRELMVQPEEVTLKNGAVVRHRFSREAHEQAVGELLNRLV